MAINDPILGFLSAEQREKPGIQTWDRAVLALRVLQTSILLIIVAAIVFAVLSVATPLALFANTTASLTGTAPPQVSTTESVPIIQPTTCVQTLSPTASWALTSDQIALLRTEYQIETETNRPPAEAWLKKFQAWAAGEDARAQVQQIVKPVQSVGAQVLQNARAEVRPAGLNRRIRSEDKAARVRFARKARANFRPAHKARAAVRLTKNAEAQVRREKHASAPEWFAHDAPARWSRRRFGSVYWAGPEGHIGSAAVIRVPEQRKISPYVWVHR
jgi:hypothetical protein